MISLMSGVRPAWASAGPAARNAASATARASTGHILRRIRVPSLVGGPARPARLRWYVLTPRRARCQRRRGGGGGRGKMGGMEALEDRLKAQARALGFELVGVAPAAPADGFDRLRDWLAR